MIVSNIQLGGCPIVRSFDIRLGFVAIVDNSLIKSWVSQEAANSIKMAIRFGRHELLYRWDKNVNYQFLIALVEAVINHN